MGKCRIGSSALTDFFLLRKFILFAAFLNKYHRCENFSSWDMDQNVFGAIRLHDFLIISLEEIDELAWLFACWHKLT